MTAGATALTAAPHRIARSVDTVDDSAGSRGSPAGSGSGGQLDDAATRTPVATPVVTPYAAQAMPARVSVSEVAQAYGARLSRTDGPAPPASNAAGGSSATAARRPSAIEAAKLLLPRSAYSASVDGSEEGVQRAAQCESSDTTSTVGSKLTRPPALATGSPTRRLAATKVPWPLQPRGTMTLEGGRGGGCDAAEADATTAAHSSARWLPGSVFTPPASAAAGADMLHSLQPRRDSETASDGSLSTAPSSAAGTVAWRGAVSNAADNVAVDLQASNGAAQEPKADPHSRGWGVGRFMSPQHAWRRAAAGDTARAGSSPDVLSTRAGGAQGAALAAGLGMQQSATSSGGAGADDTERRPSGTQSDTSGTSAASSGSVADGTVPPRLQLVKGRGAHAEVDAASALALAGAGATGVGAGDAGKEGGDDGRDDDDNEEMHEAVGHLIPEVTVVFVTVGSLCRLASRAPPVELVGLLNRLFGMMDDAASAHRVYKVMTTQDMWLGVAGALDDGGDHASRAARAALAIVKAVLRDGGHHRRHDGSQEDWSLGGERVQLQVGIHTGDVAAGVIGTRTPNWHIFGDTVRATGGAQAAGGGTHTAC
jgi:class 3 adenylate cyclase